MGLNGGTVDSVKVAKTAAATTYGDETVKNAGDNTRRRIAAANSRDKSNSFWTSLMEQKNTGGVGTGQKQTLG